MYLLGRSHTGGSLKAILTTSKAPPPPSAQAAPTDPHSPMGEAPRLEVCMPVRWTLWAGLLALSHTAATVASRVPEPSLFGRTPFWSKGVRSTCLFVCFHCDLLFPLAWILCIEISILSWIDLVLQNWLNRAGKNEEFQNSRLWQWGCLRVTIPHRWTDSWTQKHSLYSFIYLPCLPGFTLFLHLGNIFTFSNVHVLKYSTMDFIIPCLPFPLPPKALIAALVDPTPAMVSELTAAAAILQSQYAVPTTVKGERGRMFQWKHMGDWLVFSLSERMTRFALPTVRGWVCSKWEEWLKARFGSKFHVEFFSLKFSMKKNQEPKWFLHIFFKQGFRPFKGDSFFVFFEIPRSSTSPLTNFAVILPHN